MNRDCKDYFVEQGDDRNFYIYQYGEYGDDLKYIASSEEDVDKFCPGLLESLVRKPKKRRSWDHDKHLEEACRLYRQSAGWGEDEQLTEAHFKHEDWRLKNIGIKTGVHSSKLKEALLNQRTQNK